MKASTDSLRGSVAAGVKALVSGGADTTIIEDGLIDTGSDTVSDPSFPGRLGITAPGAWAAAASAGRPAEERRGTRLCR